MHGADETKSRLTPLASRRFRRLWLASVLSAAGDAASWVGLVALVLRSGDGSLPTLVALYTAPVALGGLAAGAALDRFDRRRVLAADAAVRGAAFGTIPLAALVGSVSSAHLYTAAAVFGLLKMVSLAGFPTLIPDLVDGESLASANALESAGFGMATVAGPALAGAAIGAGLDPAFVIAADAATYFVFAFVVLTTRFRDKTSKDATSRAARGAALGEVFRAVIRHPAIRDTTIMFAAFNVGEGALLVVLARQSARVGFGTGGYGWLIAAMAFGQLAAAAALLRVRWSAGLPASILAAQLAAAAVTMGLLVPNGVVTVASLVLLGCCAAPMTAWAQTLRMQATPAWMHGRLFALLRTTMQATPPLGALLAALTLRANIVAAVVAVVGCMALPALLLSRDLLRTPPTVAAAG